MLNLQSDVLDKKTDKGLSPSMVPRVLYFEQLNSHLHDATYLELTNVEITDIVQKLHVDFQERVRKFRNIQGFLSTLYNLDKYHQGAIESPHLCPITY